MSVFIYVLISLLRYCTCLYVFVHISVFAFFYLYSLFPVYYQQHVTPPEINYRNTPKINRTHNTSSQARMKNLRPNL